VIVCNCNIVVVEIGSLSDGFFVEKKYFNVERFSFWLSGDGF
jgi:hypothetical protein